MSVPYYVTLSNWTLLFLDVDRDQIGLQLDIIV